MKGILYLARAAGALAVVGLALAVPQASAVIGGTADTTHTNVGILYPDGHPWARGFCTGSLIAPHEFLTAGHCTIAASLDPARLSHLWVTLDQTVSVDPETGVISSEHPIAVTGATTYPDRSFETTTSGSYTWIRQSTSASRRSICRRSASSTRNGTRVSSPAICSRCPATD